jgi:hypothetical protein
MFWTIIIFCILAFVLFKLGVFAILVTILAVSLKVAIGLIAALGLLILWIENRKQ